MFNEKKVFIGKLTMELMMNNMKSEYKAANKAEKSELLTHASQLLSMHRKSVIRLFNRSTQVKRKNRDEKSNIIQRSLSKY